MKQYIKDKYGGDFKKNSPYSYRNIYSNLITKGYHNPDYSNDRIDYAPEINYYSNKNEHRDWPGQEEKI